MQLRLDLNNWHLSTISPAIISYLNLFHLDQPTVFLYNKELRYCQAPVQVHSRPIFGHSCSVTKRPGPGANTKFVLPLSTTKLMSFRMTHRKAFRMTLKNNNFKGVSKRTLKGTMRVLQREETSRGTSKRTSRNCSQTKRQLKFVIYYNVYDRMAGSNLLKSIHMFLF